MGLRLLFQVLAIWPFQAHIPDSSGPFKPTYRTRPHGGKSSPLHQYPTTWNPTALLPPRDLAAAAAATTTKARVTLRRYVYYVVHSDLYC